MGKPVAENRLDSSRGTWDLHAMRRILTVIGARPQFVKAAMVSEAIRRLPNLQERIVHTGQHYDREMSQVFFDELGIPEPICDLQVGSAGHGNQTGRMMVKLEETVLSERPAGVLVYGDTNSTLAGALVAAKLQIPVFHVEAGLRSFNRGMPEKINRVVVDHVSSLLLCPTEQSVTQLAREGITEGVHWVGDVMYDCTLRYAEMAEATNDPLATLRIEPKRYVLLTCHRAENTDCVDRLAEIVRGVSALAKRINVIFPAHPRTLKQLKAFGLEFGGNVRVIGPDSYLDMLVLQWHAAVVITDSGGVQKEAFFLGVPCVTLRDETEWLETVQVGANVLVGADARRVLDAVCGRLEQDNSLPDPGPFYGNGEASRRIAQLISEFTHP